MRREKHQGVYVYFSDGETAYAEQLRQRTSTSRPSVAGTISEREAIIILSLDDQVFSVIPAKAGIHELPQTSWIPGLRYATPGMTRISSSWAEKT